MVVLDNWVTVDVRRIVDPYSDICPVVPCGVTVDVNSYVYSVR